MIFAKPLALLTIHITIFSEKLRFCLKYNGKTPSGHNSIDLRVRLQLDAKSGSGAPRAFFSRKDLDKKRGVSVDRAAVSREQPNIVEQRITLNKGRETCETFDVCECERRPAVVAAE